MSISVLVAPREIVDVVYRASRVTGLDSGIASIIGRSACFACGQLGSQLDNIADALTSRSSPRLGFAPVALTEVEVIRSGSADLEVDGTFTVADLAYSAIRACRRGTSISMMCTDGVVHTPHDWLCVGRAPLEIVRLLGERTKVDAGLSGRVTARHALALREGISIWSTNWQVVNGLASEYLVEEAIIDAAESAPST